MSKTLSVYPEFSNEFLGQYRATAVTGIMAANLGAAAQVLQLRNATAQTLIAVESLTMSFASLATGFTAGNGYFRAIIERGSTAAGSGGALVDLDVSPQLMEAMPAAAGVFRIATTATLTAATAGTLDGTGVGSVLFGITATVELTHGSQNMVLFDADGPRDHPVVLASGESLVVLATVPATGTWNAAFNFRWSEITKTGRTGTVGA